MHGFLEKMGTKIIRSFFELGTLKFPPEIEKIEKI